MTEPTKVTIECCPVKNGEYPIYLMLHRPGVQCSFHLNEAEAEDLLKQLTTAIKDSS